MHEQLHLRIVLAGFVMHKHDKLYTLPEISQGNNKDRPARQMNPVPPQLGGFLLYLKTDWGQAKDKLNESQRKAEGKLEAS